MLRGVVVDGLGAVVPGAVVTLRCGTIRREAVSDGAGRFDLTAPSNGPCLLAAEAGALAAPPQRVAPGAAEPVTLELRLKPFTAEIVVTPSRGDAEQARTAPETTGVIERNDLVSRPHQILPQALREEPGVLVQQTTASQGSPIVRGLTGQGNLYLVDGTRLNTAAWRSGPSQYLAWLHDTPIERLEIMRGAGSVQYGSDAIGGTINVISAVPPLVTRGRVTDGWFQAFAASSDRSGGGELAVRVRTPHLGLQMGGSGRGLDDARAGRGVDSHAAVTRFLGLPSDTLGERLPGTGYSQYGAHLIGQLQRGDGSALTITYRHDAQTGARRYDRELGGDGLHRSGFDPQALDLAVMRYQRGRTGPFDAFAAGFSVNRQQDGQWEQARPVAPVDRRTQTTTAFGYQAQGTRLVSDRHVLLAGGDVYDEYIGGARTITSDGAAEPARPDIPDGTRYTSVGLFAQDTADLIPGRLVARAGLRYGWFSFRTERDAALGVPEEQVSTGALTFHTGATVAITTRLSAAATASRAFRAPNAFDLGGIGTSGSGYEISPSRAIGLGGWMGTDSGATAVGTDREIGSLAPETAYEFEGTLRYDTSRVSASITGFDLELRDTIQRRTIIFLESVVGAVIAGHTIVRQDQDGRAYIAADTRPIVTRVNVDEARIRGFEAQGRVRLGSAWSARAVFALTNGRELGTGGYMRRMPPPLGSASLRWQPASRPVWAEAVVTFADAQTRFNAGDLTDARIGASRSRSSIASFFSGTAVDLGLVRNGILVATGETLAQVQTRVLGTASAAAMYTETPGFAAVGVRGGLRLGRRIDLDAAIENLTDHNYRLHGSGVDATGLSAIVRARVRF